MGFVAGLPRNAGTLTPRGSCAKSRRNWIAGLVRGRCNAIHGSCPQRHPAPSTRWHLKQMEVRIHPALLPPIAPSDSCEANAPFHYDLLVVLRLAGVARGGNGR